MIYPNRYPPDIHEVFSPTYSFGCALVQQYLCSTSIYPHLTAGNFFDETLVALVALADGCYSYTVVHQTSHNSFTLQSLKDWMHRAMIDL